MKGDVMKDDKKKGCFVEVVGKSGDGKDKIMDEESVDIYGDMRFNFVRRIIKRKKMKGKEDNERIDEEDFEREEGEGSFEIKWKENGLSYGMKKKMDDEIEGGEVVIENV